jgi:8-oxo-dGTP diphosphatase
MDVAPEYAGIRKYAGGPCEQGETAASTGCVPANGPANQLPGAEDKPPVAPALDLADPHSSVPGWENPPENWKKRRYGGVVFNAKGEFLLRSPTNYFDGYVWTFAKGGLDSEAEQPLDAATREVQEELGINGNAVGAVPGAYRSHGGLANYYFLMRATGKQGPTDKETFRTRWVPYKKAKELLGRTENVKGRERDLEVLRAARNEMQKLGILPKAKAYVTKGAGEPCKPGETAASTGCTPAGGPTNALPGSGSGIVLGLSAHGIGNWSKLHDDLKTAHGSDGIDIYKAVNNAYHAALAKGASNKQAHEAAQAELTKLTSGKAKGNASPSVDLTVSALRKNGLKCTDHQAAKLETLNPNGPHKGVYYVPNALNADQIAQLKKILPPGTKIEQMGFEKAKKLVEGMLGKKLPDNPVLNKIKKAVLSLDPAGKAALLGTLSGTKPAKDLADKALNLAGAFTVKALQAKGLKLTPLQATRLSYLNPPGLHPGVFYITKAITSYQKATLDKLLPPGTIVKQFSWDKAKSMVDKMLAAKGVTHADFVGVKTGLLGLDAADTAKLKAALPPSKLAELLLAKAKTPVTFPANPDSSVEFVKKLGGTTGAELVKDKATGKLFVRKKGANAEHLVSEAAADSAYAALGIAVPKAHVYVDAAGVPTKLAEYMEGKQLSQLKSSEKPGVFAQLRQNFVADCLLGNWDVIGKDYDNILVGDDGVAYRIDNGGALGFRAQGKKKTPSQWGEAVGEIETFRNGTNYQTKAVYGDITEGEIVRQVKDVAAKRDALLKSVSKADAEVLSKRIDWLIANYGKVAPPIGENVGEAILLKKVDASAHLKAHSNAAIAALPAKQKSAVEKYSGSGYAGLNESMRKCPPKFECVHGVEKLMMDHITNAVESAGKLPEPTRVFRGIHLTSDVKTQMVALAKKLMTDGRAYRMPSITSTSLSPSTGHGFGQSIVFNIKAKSGLYVEDISHHSHEHELIQSANTRYKVLAVEDVDYTNYKGSSGIKSTTIYLEELD